VTTLVDRGFQFAQLSINFLKTKGSLAFDHRKPSLKQFELIRLLDKRVKKMKAAEDAAAEMDFVLGLNCPLLQLHFGNAVLTDRSRNP